MAKRSTIKTKDIANVLAFLWLLISIAIFFILLPIKMMVKIIDMVKYKREYRQDIADFYELLQNQQIGIMEKDKYSKVTLESTEELYKIYNNVRWLEERVTGYHRQRSGFRVSNYGFYNDNSYTKSVSVKNVVEIRRGQVYVTNKRLLMLCDDQSVKSLKYQDVEHLSVGKRTILFSKKSGGKSVILRFSVSTFTIHGIIMSLMGKPIRVPQKVQKALKSYPLTM